MPHCERWQCQATKMKRIAIKRKTWHVCLCCKRIVQLTKWEALQNELRWKRIRLSNYLIFNYPGKAVYIAYKYLLHGKCKKVGCDEPIREWYAYYCEDHHPKLSEADRKVLIEVFSTLADHLSQTRKGREDA